MYFGSSSLLLTTGEGVADFDFGVSASEVLSVFDAAEGLLPACADFTSRSFCLARGWFALVYDAGRSAGSGPFNGM